MYRIFVLIWNSADSQQTSAATLLSAALQSRSSEWDRVAGAPGLIAFQSGPPSPLGGSCVLDGKGVVLGDLYTQGSSLPFEAVGRELGEHEVSKLVESVGRRLITHYWGRYVAVLRPRGSPVTYVLRDPSGALPCYYTTYKGVRIVFSHVQDVIEIHHVPFTMNWAAMNAFLFSMPIHTGSTILNEVVEIRPGQCLGFAANGDTTLAEYWNAVDIARSDAFEDPAEAMVHLHKTVASCVHAMVSRHSRIIHLLSGGVDSSILLSCLKTAPTKPDIVCVNAYTMTPEGDERRYARSAARHLSCELIERPIDGRLVRLKDAPVASLTMTPAFYFPELTHGPFEQALARERGATAIFQGGGGDCVFLQNGAQYSPGDFVYRRGIRVNLFKVARDAATITGNSAWSLLRKALPSALKSPHWTNPVMKDLKNEFVNPDVTEWVREQERAYTYPPLLGARDVPMGKLWHIFITTSPLGFTRPYQAFLRPDVAMPFIAQPIHELCLRIPTYLLFRGGWDRSISRHGFDADLPSEVIWRRSKGGVNEMMSDFLRTNIDAIRDLLLDGVLAQRQLLDRRKLGNFFANPAATLESDRLDVLSLCDPEIFARGWTTAQAKTHVPIASIA